MAVWVKATSRERIKAAAAEIKSVEVADLARETNLRSIPIDKAYRVQGVHAYVDIPESVSLLRSEGQESERAHARFLRFLHIYERIAHLVLGAAGAMKIDFQNQRLHFVVYKPLYETREQIVVALAVASQLTEVIRKANELHAEIPNATISVGIEAGVTLAVNNGTRGDREPLFIGAAANEAAKLTNKRGGIYLGSNARRIMGANYEVADPATRPCVGAQLAECVRTASLATTEEALLAAWKREVSETPLAEFRFHRPGLPLSDLDLDVLAPANTARIELAHVVADVDGYSRFVAECVARKAEGAAIRLLHVVRKELRDVLRDLGGRKIRYVGDAIHGVVAEGDARATDAPATITAAVLTAAAMRDAFGMIQEMLPEGRELGLAIGIESGPVSITRLGVRGSRDRCAAGLAVHASEEMQHQCKGTETGLGEGAIAGASPGIRALFASGTIQSSLTYNKVAAALDSLPDQTRQRFAMVEPAPSVTMPRAHAKGNAT